MNGWHGSAHPAMHTRSNAVLALHSTQQIVRYDNRTATIRCTAGMNGWHGSAQSAQQQRTASTTARSRLCT
jgi:hypothetical protein